MPSAWPSPQAQRQASYDETRGAESDRFGSTWSRSLRNSIMILSVHEFLNPRPSPIHRFNRPNPSRIAIDMLPIGSI
jgi:hypothetical protein